MYSNMVNIDWMTLTKKYPQSYWVEGVGFDTASVLIAAAVMRELGFETYSFEPRVGVPGYRYGYKDVHSDVTVFVSERIETQGVMVQVPGSFNEQIMATGTLLAVALDHGWHVTRIDIAIDLFNTGIKPEFVHHLYSMYHPRAPRNTSLIVGQGGSTFYLGSRQSESMMRIYDKGAEQKVERDWLRIESEYKGAKAIQAANMALRNIYEIVADMRRMIDLPMYSLDILLEMLHDEEVGKLKGRVALRADREAWLMTQVMSAVKNLARDDYDAACRFRDAVVELLEADIF